MGRTQDGERANSLRSDKARRILRASDPGAEQQALIGEAKGDKGCGGSQLVGNCFSTSPQHGLALREGQQSFMWKLERIEKEILQQQI